MSETQKIAVYGKGGIGKSVVATNLSASFALQERRVLHIGCDPKADSAVRLLQDGQKLRTVLDVIGDSTSMTSTGDIIARGRHNIDCCESGGPEPGLGCGGRGVARMLEFLDEMEVIEAGNYDAVLFDVLGDVVCGGFAAPLRRGFAEKIVIVLSEEPMALFAANNISKAVRTYEHNGVFLAGLVANLRTKEADQERIEAFAKHLSTRVLTYIPREPLIGEAEVLRRTIVEYAPDCEAAKAFATLAQEVEEAHHEDAVLPTPLTEEEFFEFLRDN